MRDEKEGRKKQARSNKHVVSVGLQEADPERVVQFLHILLNNLSSLLVRPCVTGESGENSTLYVLLLNPHTCTC